MNNLDTNQLWSARDPESFWANLANSPEQERAIELFAFTNFVLDSYHAGLVTKREVGFALSPAADTTLVQRTGDVVMIGNLAENLESQGHLTTEAKYTDSYIWQLGKIAEKYR